MCGVDILSYQWPCLQAVVYRVGQKKTGTVFLYVDNFVKY